MIKIPNSDRIFSQPNSSDLKGNVFATKHINFDEEGYLKLSPGIVGLKSTDADWDDVQSMFKADNATLFLSDDTFSSSDVGISTTFTNLTTSESAPTPGPEDDGTFFNGEEVITDGASIRYRNGGAWTSITGTPVSATKPNVVQPFPAQTGLLVGAGNQVALVNTSWTVVRTLTISAEYQVSSIDCNGTFAYIGTRHIANGEAVLVKWDGTATSPNALYPAGTFEIFSVKAYDSSVVVITSSGQLRRFNGGGFTDLASLPIYYTNVDWADALNDYSGVTHRGMEVDGSTIYINVANMLKGNKKYLPYFYGGLWCYDPNVGLYHKSGTTNNEVLSDTDVDTADINTTTNVITVVGITVPSTGSPVFYADGGTSIGGLIDRTWYYTIYVSDTTFKLAKSPEDAANGTAIDLTSASDNNEFSFVKQNDYVGVYQDNRGAVLTLPNTLYESQSVNHVIYGSMADNTALTVVPRIVVSSPAIEARGSYISPKIFSPTLKSSNVLGVKWRPLQYGDEINIKYRSNERFGLPVGMVGDTDSNYQGTWTSTTTFTTTLDLSDVIAGDEVEIIGGAGAGHTSHVSSISESSGTYTVTIDEANALVSNTELMFFVISNFKLLESIDYTTVDTSKVIPLPEGSQGGWLQIKTELRGRETTIEELLINDKNFKDLT